MKLIIDIEDEALERLSTVDPNLLYSAIKNGKPYEGTTSGDLISREALKKAVTEQVTHTTVDGHLAKNKAIQLIDNATTVAKDYDTGYQDGLEDGLNDIRPHGKWEYNQYDGNPNIGNWHCSECRHIVFGEYNQKPYYNFCPYCGAEMGGNTE